MKYVNVELQDGTGFRARLTAGGTYHKYGEHYTVVSISDRSEQPKIKGLDGATLKSILGTYELVFQEKKTGRMYSAVNNQEAASIMCIMELPSARLTVAPLALADFVHSKVTARFSNPIAE